jgi:two-component system, NarL family, sensor histidine kinase UhpB
MLNPTAEVASSPTSDHGEGPAKLGTTLKLRLSLLITAVLAMVTVAGGIYIVQKAGDDAREEARSTVTLTSHLLDAQIEGLRSQWENHGYSPPQFNLNQLEDIRHLSIKFYDANGRLVDSNEDPTREKPSMPDWFGEWVRLASPIGGSQIRRITWGGFDEGHVVIGPDPSYETEEMWEICSGLLELLLCFFVVVNAMVWWAASRAMRPVEKILQALGELRRGNLSARLPGFGLPELSRISVGFNHMAETLEFSVNENQRLTRQLLTAQETERTSLAREPHDELGQCVSAIHADAAAIRNRGGESVRESAEAIVAVTTHIKQIVRSMLQRLRPPIVEGLGLTPALRDLVAAFQQRNPQVAWTLHTSDEVGGLEGEMGVSVYRVIQECLTNIAVHANAHHADIRVTLIEELQAATRRRVIRVTVADDGVGFFLMSVNRGFGLTGIRERVKALGGTCSIDAHPGQGTRIVANIPMPDAGDAPQ